MSAKTVSSLIGHASCTPLHHKRDGSIPAHRPSGPRQRSRKWHRTQGVSSEKIKFFNLASSELVDYSRPYLCGFDFTHTNDGYSAPKYAYDLDGDYYRHPNRQGIPIVHTHKKYRDIYSYGVVLLELGLRDPVDKISGSRIREEMRKAHHRSELSMALTHDYIGNKMRKRYEKNIH